MDPPKIECLDLSYCGLKNVDKGRSCEADEEVFTELAAAASNCSSLRVLSLQGNEMESVSLSHLFASLAAHHAKFGRAYIPSHRKQSSWVFLDLQILGASSSSLPVKAKDTSSSVFPLSLLVDKMDERFNLRIMPEKDIKYAFLNLGMC